MSKNRDEKIVTPQGSLGLLALGYVGLMAWREEKLKENNKKKTPK